ncbi:hypothetical protein AMELA_G00048830 [Ameiurus melas]|uniref:CEP170 C-terminal domain-containing protein n=1 Tax=Ameiurus melas TaxID=219545 RepID=A0A7J6B7X0_AMEME|nr:hypothetical protein AMELA_G00048830 [Ameiurus melas]
MLERTEAGVASLAAVEAGAKSEELTSIDPAVVDSPLEETMLQLKKLDLELSRQRSQAAAPSAGKIVMLDRLSLSCPKKRQSVDKTAGKIKILFKDRNWDDIESKLSSYTTDIPLLKTTNKEISTILTELKRVEKQIQAIDIMLNQDETLAAFNNLNLVSPMD